MAGWAVMAGLLGLGLLLSLTGNVVTGVDGSLYPFTSYPMFSEPLPDRVARYVVEGHDAQGAVVARVAFADSFDPRASAWPGLVGRLAGKLSAEAASQCPADPEGVPTCDAGSSDAMAGLWRSWNSTSQARGQGQAQAFWLVRESRPVGAPWASADSQVLFVLVPSPGSGTA